MKKSACSLLIAEPCFPYHCYLGTDEVSRTAPHVLLLIFAVTWCETSAPKCTSNNTIGAGFLAHGRGEGSSDWPIGVKTDLQPHCSWAAGTTQVKPSFECGGGKKEDCSTQQWGWNPMLLKWQRTLAVRARQQRYVAGGCCVRLLWHEAIVKDRWIGCVWFVSYGLSVRLDEGVYGEPVPETSHPITGKSCKASSPHQVLLNNN